MDRNKYTREVLDKLGEKLYTAVICDILDDLGYRNQAMDDVIAPLCDEDKLIGFAKTMLFYDVYEQPEKPYATELAAVDRMIQGDVAVICGNGSKSNGFWGELMATASIVRGVRGVVLDGAVRDIKKLRMLSNEFKIFATGRSPLDSKGRCIVAVSDCHIVCRGVSVNNDDLIFGDIDGVVVVPSAVAEKAINLALIKISEENKVRDALLEGLSLTEAFEKYGVL